MNSRPGVTATADMAVLPDVLGCRLLRRTTQVRLGSNTLRVPGGTTIFAVSRQQFINYPGQGPAKNLIALLISPASVFQLPSACLMVYL